MKTLPFKAQIEMFAAVNRTTGAVRTVNGNAVTVRAILRRNALAGVFKGCLYICYG
jgi:hypothetical protein